MAKGKWLAAALLGAAAAGAVYTGKKLTETAPSWIYGFA